MASADYLCCWKCGCKIVYTPEDNHPNVYCPDCLEAEFAKVDKYRKALKQIVRWQEGSVGTMRQDTMTLNFAKEALKDA